jgi:hypothetical protein
VASGASHSFLRTYGVAIPSIQELQHLGFKDNDINEAFGKLQQESSVIRHGGLYPKGTELVFLRQEPNALKFKAYLTNYPNFERIPADKLNEVLENDLYLDPVDVNGTWL